MKSTSDITTESNLKVKQPHWYHITIYECALCGRTDEYRTRMYGKKPESHKERYEWYQTACDFHFM